MNKNAPDIFKINDGKLGIVNINNMIPSPKSCLTEVLPLVKDKQYRKLIIEQTTYLNNHKKRLMNKIKWFMLQYNKNILPKRIMDRCCDFNLLEEKCKEYEKEVLRH